MEHGNRPGLWCLAFVFLIFHSEADLRIDSPSHLEVQLGQNVTLPCVVTDSKQPQIRLNLQTDSVRWDVKSVNGSVRTVYLLTDGVHTANRPKSNIDEDDFRRGIASLNMWDILEGDEGEYTCFVYVTPQRPSATISVQVSAKPTVTLTSYEFTLEPGHEKSVICEVTRFYPKTVTIRWFKARKNSYFGRALDKETCNSVPAGNNDGTFNATSLISVKPSSTDEDGDIYSCIVSHRSFKGDQAVNFTLTVKEQPPTYWIHLLVTLVTIPIVLILGGSLCFVFWCIKDPEVSAISGAEFLMHMKPSKLSCSLSYFKSKAIYINVYLRRKGASEKMLICSWKPSQNQTEHQNDEMQLLSNTNPPGEPDRLLELHFSKCKIFFYKCVCPIQITPDLETDNEAILTVEVEHYSLKTPITKDCTLRVNGDCLKLQPIRAPEHLTHGQEVTLSCKMTKYAKGPLDIEWLKEDLLNLKETEVICKNRELCVQRYSHNLEDSQDESVYVLTSYLTFMANVIEDHGKKYICKAFYRALDQRMESALNTYVRAVPILKPITSEPELPSAGREMELSCNILLFHPRELKVEWYKEGDLMPQTTDTTKVDDDGLFSVTSSFKHTCEMKDLGKTFRCKVVHKSFTDPQILEWRLNSYSENL